MDALKAHGILVRLAQAHGGIVAPSDYWHVHELGGYAVWAYENVGEVRPWQVEGSEFGKTALFPMAPSIYSDELPDSR
ncbi:MAG: hypothetical protein O2901_05020 [Verrucomicrobia bacterium]|nr:hypothetical protein [Verrucomicrobiota bacterium]